MRIALIMPGFSANDQDWCIPALFNLTCGLAQAHEVVVFTLRYPYRRGTYTLNGAQVHALGGGLTRGVGRARLWGRALAALQRASAEKPFDVIHAFWADEPGFLATLAGRRLRTPVVVSLMGGELACLPDIGYGGRLNRWNNWLTRWSLRRAERVTAGSHWLAQMALDLGYAPIRPIWLPLGVDTRMFRPNPFLPPRPSPGRQLLCVASLLPVKDHATLLRALALTPKCRLDIVGNGPLRAELKELATRLDVGARVTWRGEVPHGQVPALYRAADLHVLASRHESQSMATLEAAACGTLCVGTAVGILPELTPAAGLAAPGDVAGLARAIQWGLGDSAERRAAAQSSPVKARILYSLEAAQTRQQVLYAGLIDGLPLLSEDKTA